MIGQRVPPSRYSNPFATCWTRPGALPYVAGNAGIDPAAVVDRLAHSEWRGQLVGPHGSGKSTLLAAIAEPIESRGVGSRLVDLTSPEGRFDPWATKEVLIIEGFERLGLRQRAVCLRRLRESHSRFLITTHRTHRGWRAPAVLARMSPDIALLEELFVLLVTDRPTPVRLADARRSHRKHRGNLRAVWFDLYNLHESLSRIDRTAPVSASYFLPVAVG